METPIRSVPARNGACVRCKMPASAGGLYVVDTVANAPVMPDPVPLPGFPVDQVIGPIGSPFDARSIGHKRRLTLSRYHVPLCGSCLAKGLA